MPKKQIHQAPFTVGQIIRFRRSALIGHPEYMINLNRLFVVTAIKYAPKGCQSDWLITAEYRGNQKIYNPIPLYGNILAEFDSSWFRAYEGGTTLAPSQEKTNAE